MNGSGSTLEEIGFLTLEALNAQYRLTAVAAGVPVSELGPPLRIPRSSDGAPTAVEAPSPPPATAPATPDQIRAAFTF